MKRWLLGLSLAFCGVTTGVVATLPPTVAALAEAADRREADLSLWSAALASDDRSLQSAALRGLARIGGDDRLALLLPFLADDSAELRAEAAFAIGILDCQDPARQREQAQALLQQLTREPDSQVRSALLRALGNRGDDGSQQALRDYQLTGRDAAEQAAWAQAVGLLWSYRRGQLAAIDPALVDRLLALTVSAEPVAEMAAFALARARKEAAVQARAGQLRHAFGASPSAGARLFLLRALAPTIASSASAAPWLRAQQRQRLGGRTLSAAERVELHAALVASLNGPALRTAVATGLRAPAAAERLAVLQALANRPVEAQTLRDVLQAHAGLQPVDQAWLAPLLEPAHADSVAEEEEPLEPVSATRPYAEAIQAVGVRYRLATVRGAIDIELLPDAVYTAANFATLADRGFYDQTRFHRVIGNFVAQGGDPTGTGSGGPGWRIREELSPLPHAPGFVGMATAGKDSAGSQFFINTGRNPHLDWHYTIFAKVIAGQAVVQALLPGDQVLTVRRLP